jgi:prepilin-type N-terminal cleavage/methylation domain-containing protein
MKFFFFPKTENRKPKTAPPGFSLLEVLVATALVGLVLVALLQLLSASWRAQEASAGQVQALMVAERVLGEYVGARELKAGHYGGSQGRFAYRVNLYPQYEVIYPSQGKKLTCFLIQVTVSWEDRGQAKSTGLETARVVVLKG